MLKIPIPVLILQHPQEPSRKDAAVSSAQILMSHLSPCFVSVGLSWRNLEHATKKFEALEGDPELKKPSLWATLYLGTQKQKTETITEPGIYDLDKKGNLIEEGAKRSDLPIGGLILLDGTWAQAKTLWWRNAWLLKTRRMLLVPKEKSLYGKIRKEPRPECVSTLEALAETLSFLGVEPRVEQELKLQFKLKLRETKQPN